MNPPQATSLLFFSIIFFLDYVSAQPPPPPYTTNDLFKPTLIITIGVFSIVFTLTFSLLVYAKCFHNSLRSETDEEGDIGRLDRLWQGLFSQSSRLFTGLNKTAIESLPFFRFSALKGSKQGLECSVCLSKFEDVEMLRLLPKCKHAFHIECIDEWLEQHATCPLCRNRVCIEDELSVFSVLGCSSSSMRIMSQLPETREQEDSSMEIYIEREEGEDSSRFGSFRKILKFGKNDKSLSLVEQGNEKRMHKFRHRIVVSDAVFKNRWSNVSPSDLTRLTSDMLNSMSSDRFSSMDEVERGDLRDKEEMDMKRMVKNKDSTRRAVSEITAVPRRNVLEVTTATKENAVGGSDSGLVAASNSRSDTVAAMEERRRQLWLPIARKTAHWFVNREKGNEELNTTIS